VTTAQKLITADEFAERPDPEDGTKEELVEGVIEVSPLPGEEHGDIQASLIEALRPFVRKRRLGRLLGESGFIVHRGPDTVRGPDVSFIAVRAGSRGRGQGFVSGAPELAIEVLSPSDRAGRVQRKVEGYFGAGAARVWLVRPTPKTVTVLRADETSEVLGVDDTLTSEYAAFDAPGFELPVRTLFEDL
jgi:Uma2 family endonuclease